MLFWGAFGRRPLLLSWIYYLRSSSSKAAERAVYGLDGSKSFSFFSFRSRTFNHAWLKLSEPARRSGRRLYPTRESNVRLLALSTSEQRDLHSSLSGDWLHFC